MYVSDAWLKGTPVTMCDCAVESVCVCVRERERALRALRTDHMYICIYVHSYLDMYICLSRLNVNRVS